MRNGYNGTEAEWLKSLKGDQIHLSCIGTVLSYKYAGDTDWIPLIDLACDTPLLPIPLEDIKNILSC